jgi:hypothetical protein
MREVHDLCAEAGDVASTSLLETWIDEAQRRVWFLFESTRKGDSPDRSYVDGSEDHNCRSTLLHTSFLECAQQIARFAPARPAVSMF